MYIKNDGEKKKKRNSKGEKERRKEMKAYEQAKGENTLKAVLFLHVTGYA